MPLAGACPPGRRTTHLQPEGNHTTAEQLRAAKAEIERLKARLESAGGSLFDLKNNSVKEIAEAIAANISEGKAADLAKAILEAVRQRKRKQQKPGG
jgi:hypothetical protein